MGDSHSGGGADAALKLHMRGGGAGDGGAHRNLDCPIRAIFCRVSFLANRVRGSKNENRRFEVIRANRSNVMRTGVLLRIESHESIRASRLA